MTEEKHSWGVRLTASPAKGLQIEVSITRKVGRAPDITVMFSGASPQSALKLVEATAWANTMTQMLARAREISREMRKISP